MKFVVIGGKGRIGSRVVHGLLQHGHEVVVASRRTGINSLTGEGVQQALTNVDVLVDVSDSPSFEEAAVFEFFTNSTKNLLNAAKSAKVGHYVALSVVGVGAGEQGPYFRAKSAQEALIRESNLPYTVVQTTQFYEFLSMIAMVATKGNEVRLPSALMQPLSADDAGDAVIQAALSAPVNGVIEVAGPEQLPMFKFIGKYLSETKDKRTAIADDSVAYFGTKLRRDTLVPKENSVIKKTKLEDWLKKVLVSVAAFIIAFSASHAAFAQDQKSKISMVFDHALPNVPGKSMKAVLVEYAPGGSTPAHTHAKSAFIYATVLEGAIKSRVNDGPVKTYKKGENFSENPGDVHSVSENASKTKPAKLLAVFVVDTDEKELTTIIPNTERK